MNRKMAREEQTAEEANLQGDQRAPAPAQVMEEDLKGFNIAFVIAQVLGITCVILVAIWTSSYGGGFAWSSNAKLQFNWHPLMMTVGFIYLYANSIMIYRALRAMRKQKLKVIHASIHTVVVICVIIAQVAVFSSHNNAKPPIPNLYSLHSWVGLIAVLIYVLQWVGGLVVFLWPGASMQIRAAVMPWHVFLGLGAFILAIVAAISGLNEKAIFSIENYTELPGHGLMINFIGIFFVLFAFVTVYLVTEPKYKRHPRPEDGALLKSSSTE